MQKHQKKTVELDCLRHIHQIFNNAILEFSLFSRSMNSNRANILFHDLYPEGYLTIRSSTATYTHTSIEAEVLLREIIKFRPLAFRTIRPCNVYKKYVTVSIY